MCTEMRLYMCWTVHLCTELFCYMYWIVLLYVMNCSPIHMYWTALLFVLNHARLYELNWSSMCTEQVCYVYCPSCSCTRLMKIWICQCWLFTQHQTFPSWINYRILHSQFFFLFKLYWVFRYITLECYNIKFAKDEFTKILLLSETYRRTIGDRHACL